MKISGFLNFLSVLAFLLVTPSVCFGQPPIIVGTGEEMPASQIYGLNSKPIIQPGDIIYRRSNLLVVYKYYYENTIILSAGNPGRLRRMYLTLDASRKLYLHISPMEGTLVMELINPQGDARLFISNEKTFTTVVTIYPEMF